MFQNALLLSYSAFPFAWRIRMCLPNILEHFTLHPPPYSGVLHIPKLRNHNKWHIIVKRNNRAFQWYQMQGKWVGNKREIVSQTWVSELFVRSLYIYVHGPGPGTLPACMEHTITSVYWPKDWPCNTYNKPGCAHSLTSILQNHFWYRPTCIMQPQSSILAWSPQSSIIYQGNNHICPQSF